MNAIKTNKNKGPEETEVLKKKLEETEATQESKDIHVFQKLWYFFFSQTSAIHRQEAREKYWILWRELEAAMFSRAIELNFSFAGFTHKSPKEVEDLINAFLKVLESKGCNEKTRTFGNLLLYARILSKQQLEMLNKADELNMIWRDITFVRSRLLTDDIIPNDRLAAHLEYCRLECGKICSENNIGKPSPG